jgi:dethiobiotin synthetase
MMSYIHFVTGTDTGAGKTVLAASLLYYLRRTGTKALGMKPFAAGSRTDVRTLQRIQNCELSVDECNPFYFRAPLAPGICAHHISCREALQRILSVQAKCEALVVEGIGGVMVPLGRDYTVRDLIDRLGCQVWVAASNRLGTINHSLLTVAALRMAKPRSIRLVLMNQAVPDPSSRSNESALRTLLKGCRVAVMPHLGINPVDPEALARNWKKVKKVLAPLLGSSNFCARFPEGAAKKCG